MSMYVHNIKDGLKNLFKHMVISHVKVNSFHSATICPPMLRMQHGRLIKLITYRRREEEGERECTVVAFRP